MSQLTAEILYPGLPTHTIADLSERDGGDRVRAVEPSQAQTVQLHQQLRVEVVVVAAHSRSLGVLGLLSVAQLLPFSGVPAVGDGLDVYIEEGVTLDLHQLRVEGTEPLWEKRDGERSVLQDSLCGSVGRLGTDWS